MIYGLLCLSIYHPHSEIYNGNARPHFACLWQTTGEAAKAFFLYEVAIKLILYKCTLRHAQGAKYKHLKRNSVLVFSALTNVHGDTYILI
jgi:hypothetical protein